MIRHHGGKALERRQTAPFQGIDPLPEELRRPGPGPEVPEVVEGLLEKIRLEESRARQKKLRESLFGLALQVRPPGQKNELLPRKEPLDRSAQALDCFRTSFTASRRCRITWNLS